MLAFARGARTAYRLPAEWEAHHACWLAWPCAADLWKEDLVPAQRSFAALCRAIASAPANELPEIPKVLVPNAQCESAARRALQGIPARFYRADYGDIWLRDTGPLFVRGDEGTAAAAVFKFNGWGGKYILPGDGGVALAIAELARTPSISYDWVLEGGSVEVDGQGTCLTTRQCLLNTNRNPSLDEQSIERRLGEALGVSRVLWLEEGLLNDHTDGHVDTLARFVGPARVVCMEARSSADPNRRALEAIARALERFKDAHDSPLEVIRIPSPGSVIARGGEPMPASYVNFYIANHAVGVPVYGTPFDEEAVSRIAALFPGRRTLGIDAKALLEGGGAFHCVTQQQPSSPGVDT
jgi:agmatine deiminase